MGWGSSLAIGMLEAVSVQVWKRRGGGNTNPPPYISLYILENGIFFFHPRWEASQAFPSQQQGCAIPRAAIPCHAKKTRIIWLPIPDFASNPIGEGMPGSLGVQQQINCIALTLLPLSDHRRKICCCKHHGKNQGSLLSHLPDEGKENEPWRGKTRELQ